MQDLACNKIAQQYQNQGEKKKANGNGNEQIYDFLLQFFHGPGNLDQVLLSRKRDRENANPKGHLIVVTLLQAGGFPGNCSADIIAVALLAHRQIGKPGHGGGVKEIMFLVKDFKPI